VAVLGLAGQQQDGRRRRCGRRLAVWRAVVPAVVRAGLAWACRMRGIIDYLFDEYLGVPKDAWILLLTVMVAEDDVMPGARLVCRLAVLLSAGAWQQLTNLVTSYRHQKVLLD
jgi:hypothetical protein